MDELAFLFLYLLLCLHNRLSYFNSTQESIYVYCNQRWCWGLFLVGLVLKTKLFVISNINWSEGIRSSLGSLSNQTGIIRIPLHCWNPAVLFLSFAFLFSFFFSPSKGLLPGRAGKLLKGGWEGKWRRVGCYRKRRGLPAVDVWRPRSVWKCATSSLL